MNITLILLLLTYDLQNPYNTVFEVILHKDLKALKNAHKKKKKITGFDKCIPSKRLLWIYN